MAKGPGDRYVVGGGQCEQLPRRKRAIRADTPDLRVLEISNPADDSPKDSSPKSIRQAGTPFARGPGGVTVSEVVNFWKGSWAIGKGVNDVDWGTGREWRHAAGEMQMEENANLASHGQQDCNGHPEWQLHDL